MTESIAQKPKLGISACLLGHKVRYDGKDKHKPELIAFLSRYFHLVPFCPEVEAGLGIPRLPIVLQKKHGQIRAIQGQRDVSEALRALGRRLDFVDIVGYVFKSQSPSCGLAVPIHDNQGMAQGLFAEALLKDKTIFAIEEEALQVEVTLKRFIEKTLASQGIKMVIE